MKSKYLILGTIVLVFFAVASCGSDEEPFVCATNTVFLFEGASDKWCGRSEFRQYSYNEVSDEESANIFVRYPAGNVSILLFSNDKFTVGNLYSNNNGLGLSGDISSINSASLVFTKIDRDLELVSFEFNLDYMAQSNLTHWNVKGTVTDLALKVE